MKKLTLAKELAEWAAELRKIHGPSIYAIVEPGTWDKLNKLSGSIQNTADRLVQEIAEGTLSIGDYDQFVNDILKNTPDSWDDDVAAEAIALDYVKELESRVTSLGGSLEKNKHYQEE